MTNRKLNIEFIRFFSVIMVISIHVANVYIRRFDTVPQGYFLTATISSSIFRVCVPLFFMISGAFMGDKEFDKKSYLYKVFKFVGILAIWSIIYYFTKNGFEFEGIGKVIANSFFNADMTSRHLWYMYPLIAIYIALPFLQNMCKNLNKEAENLFMILWFLLSGLSFIYMPLAEFITKSNINLEYPVPLINSAYYVGYFISGHILYKRFKDESFGKKQNLICIGVYLVSTIITVLSTYFISLKVGYAISPPTWYRGALVIIASFAVFLLIIAIPVITVIVYICSLISCMLLSKIPFLKKILF